MYIKHNSFHLHVIYNRFTTNTLHVLQSEVSYQQQIAISTWGLNLYKINLNTIVFVICKLSICVLHGGSTIQICVHRARARII